MASLDSFFGSGSGLGGTTFSGSATGGFGTTSSFSGSATAPITYGSAAASLPSFATGGAGTGFPSTNGKFSLNGLTLGSSDVSNYVGGGGNFSLDGATLGSSDASSYVGGAGSGDLSSILGGASSGSFGDLSGLSSLFGGGSGGSSGSGGAASFLDNPLNPFAQVAYHWRLFSTGDTDSGKEIIIAETGKTGFNIRDVHINSFVGPNAQTQNTQMTDFTMTVVETTGIAFLDGLYLAAVSNQVKNIQKAFYWLEVSFKGYKETGEIVDLISEGVQNGGKWKYKIVITSIDTELKASGAEYSIKGNMIHDVALEPQWLGVQSNVMIKAKTVEEFFKSLAQQLNADVERMNGAKLVNYSFKFHGSGNDPNPGEFKIIGGSTAVDTFRQLSMVEGQRDTWTANVARGTLLSKLVEDIIGVTKEGQALAMHGKKDGDTSKPPSGEFRETVSYRVYPQVTFSGDKGPGDYNYTFGQYLKQVVFHVKPFRTQGTIMNAQETSLKDAQDKAWAAVKDRTKKKYEYIFTGLNTEVINLELKFNTAWSATLPRLAGWEYMNEMVEHSARYDAEGDKKLKDFIAGQKQAQQGGAMMAAGGANLSNAAGAVLGSATGNALTTGIAQAFAGVGTAGASTSTDGSVSNLFNSGLAAANQITQGQALANKGELAQQQAAQSLQQQAAAANPTAANASSGSFVEDLLGNGANPAVFTQMSLSQQAESARRANGTGMMAQRGTIGRSVYGAMLDQLYDNRMFQVIDLTIRGDPYWLGGNYDSVFSDAAPDANTVDYSKGDVCFALMFKYPYGVGEETGQPTFRTQDAYNGAYRALKITHDFVDGKFTQTVHAMRMAKIPAATTNQAIQSASGSAAGSGAAGTAAGTGTNLQATTGDVTAPATSTAASSAPAAATASTAPAISTGSGNLTTAPTTVAATATPTAAELGLRGAST